MPQNESKPGLLNTLTLIAEDYLKRSQSKHDVTICQRNSPRTANRIDNNQFRCRHIDPGSTLELCENTLSSRHTSVQPGIYSPKGIYVEAGVSAIICTYRS
jgi:hypothetical protein